MTASDHLSPGQFPRMPLDQIMRLPSSDAPPGGTVADVLPRKAREVAEDPHGEFGPLRADMAAHGQRWPIHVDPDTGVGNGHHRIAIAQQLGWKDMAYSPEFEDTGEEFEGFKDERPGWYR